MSATATTTFDEVREIRKRRSQERAKLIYDQKRQLFRDLAEGKVSKTSEDVILEIDQLELTDEELRDGVALAKAEKENLAKFKMGQEAESKSADLNHQIEALMAEEIAAVKAVGDKYRPLIEQCRFEMAALQGAMTVGNNANVWLRQHFPPHVVDSIQKLQSQIADTRREKQRLWTERESMNTLGHWTKENREAWLRREAALDQRLQEISQQMSAIESDALQVA